MEKNLDKISYFLKNNRIKEAEQEILKLLSAKPNDYLLLYNYGLVLSFKKDFFAAINQFKKVISLKSNFYEAYYNIAFLYFKLSLIDDSLDYLKNYLSNEFNNCDAYNLLGIILMEKNVYDEAIVNFNKCISLKSNYINAYNNIGIAFYKKKDFKKSIYFLENGIKLDPNFNALYLNLAKSYSCNDQYLLAIDKIKSFLINEPNNPTALFLLGDYLINVGKISEGLDFIKKALVIDPSVRESYSTIIFNMNYLENIDYNEYFNFVDKLKSLFIKFPDEKTNLIKKNINIKKINIGFISADFNNHAVAYQIIEILEHLSKNINFELFAYFNNENEDFMTKKIKKNFKNWLNISNLDNLSLTKKIKLDNIDILLDLSGYTKGNRMEVFFNKPAKIQISWVGYLASTGLKEIDYIIADNNSITKNEEHQFVERIYKLNNLWTVLKPEYDIPLNNKIPITFNKYITFGSFNNIQKINNTVIEVWSKILCNIENAKLILISSKFNDENFKEYFSRLFLNHKVKVSQLIFEGSCERNDLLNKYNSIDIALDTFPYNGGTTTLEASWMCVPVLTKRGNSFLSKCGESVNINLDLHDWICNSNEDYINKAIEMSKDIKKLQSVKNYLINNRKNFKIFNSKIFANDLGDAFKNIASVYNNA